LHVTFVAMLYTKYNNICACMPPVLGQSPFAARLCICETESSHWPAERWQCESSPPGGASPQPHRKPMCPVTSACINTL